MRIEDPVSLKASFRELKCWVEDTLDIFRAELLRVLYPLFVHVYLELVASHKPEIAKDFFSTFRDDFETLFPLKKAELSILSSVIDGLHVRDNNIACTYRSHKYKLGLGQYAFDLFRTYLEDRGLSLFMRMISHYFDIKIGRAGADGIVGVDAFSDVSVDVRASIVCREAEDAVLASEAYKYDPVEQFAAQLKRQRCGTQLRSTSPTLINAEIAKLRDLCARVAVSSQSLPSACCYTIFGGAPACAELSEDCRLLAIGFEDSTIEIISLDGNLRRLKTSAELGRAEDPVRREKRISRRAAKEQSDQRILSYLSEGDLASRTVGTPFTERDDDNQSNKFRSLETFGSRSDVDLLNSTDQSRSHSYDPGQSNSLQKNPNQQDTIYHMNPRYSISDDNSNMLKTSTSTKGPKKAPTDLVNVSNLVKHNQNLPRWDEEVYNTTNPSNQSADFRHNISISQNGQNNLKSLNSKNEEPQKNDYLQDMFSKSTPFGQETSFDASDHLKNSKDHLSNHKNTHFFAKKCGSNDDSGFSNDLHNPFLSKRRDLHDHKTNSHRDFSTNMQNQDLDSGAQRCSAPGEKISAAESAYFASKARASDDGFTDAFEEQRRTDIDYNLEHIFGKQTDKKEQKKDCTAHLYTDIGQSTRLIGHSGPVYAIKFFKGNKYLLSCSQDCTVRLWSLELFTCLAIYKSHVFPIWTIDVSPNNLHFASGGADKHALLWSIMGNRPERLFISALSDVTILKFHPNGNYLFIGSNDCKIRMHSINDAQLLRIYNGHTDGISCIEISSCGKLMLTGSRDKTIILWDIATSKVVAKYSGHEGTIYSVAFCWFGNLIASVGSDNTMRLWDRSENKDKPCAVFMTKNTPLFHVRFEYRNIISTVGPYQA